MSQVIVRHATLQDYQGVLDIGIVYDGMDYLPYFYKEFVQDPDYLCYVCEVDGEIVAFRCILIHDSGRVAQGRAGRTKPSHRGRGYSKLISEAVDKDLGDLPSLQTTTFVQGRRRVNWETVIPPLSLVENSSLYEFTISKSRCHLHPSSYVTRMYEEDLQALFEAPSVCQRLFPRNLIHVYYLPLGLDKGNIRHVINDNTRVFATTSMPDMRRNASNVKDKTQIDPTSIRLLTIGWIYKVPNGPACSITIYGNDLDTLDNHVQAQIHETPSTTHRINLCFYTPETFPKKIIKSIFRKYGTEGNSNFNPYPMCTIKRELEPQKPKAKY